MNKRTPTFLRGFALLWLALGYVTHAAEPEANKPPMVDLYGDRLPPHAVLRLGTTRLHHQSSVNDAAFSPDGRLLATATDNQNGGVTLWEVPSGRLLRYLTVPLKDGFRPWVHALAFSPDGKTLLAGDSRGTLYLWNAVTGEKEHSIEAHLDGLGATAVAFSADGEWFASGGADGVVRVWSTLGRHELLSFDTVPPPQSGSGGLYLGVFPPGSIAALTFSPDGKSLAAGIAQLLGRSKASKILVWNIATNEPKRWLGEPNGFLSSLLYTPDGKHLISGENVLLPRERLGRPYPYLEAHLVRLRVWDAQTGKLVRELATPQKEPGLGALALSSDGRTLASGYEDKILLWDLASATARSSIEVPQWRGGHGLAISPDGQLVCAPVGNTIGLWNAATAQPLLADAPSHDSFVNGIAYLADGRSIITSGGGTIRLWNADTGRQTWCRRFGGHAYINALAASPDGALIAAGGQTEEGETAVRVYQAATGDEKHFIPMFRKKWYANGVRALAFTPDGRTLAVVRGRPKDPTTYDLDLFDVETAERRKEVACGIFAGVHPLAFARDGGSLYSIGQQDAAVNLWNLTTGEPKRLFTALKPAAETPPGKPQQPFAAGAAFAPDQKLLVTSQGRDLILWNLANGDVLATIASEGTEHGGKIAISPDGRWLAMTDLNYGGDPGSDALRLFDLKSGRLIATYDTGRDRPSSFAFSPDGAHLATGMGDGTALVWNLPDAADH